MRESRTAGGFWFVVLTILAVAVVVSGARAFQTKDKCGTTEKHWDFVHVEWVCDTSPYP